MERLHHPPPGNEKAGNLVEGPGPKEQTKSKSHAENSTLPGFAGIVELRSVGHMLGSPVWNT
jgi:hypothetical protein